MDPVIGLDIAKGESQVQAFLQRKKPYKQTFKFAHNLQGLHTFYNFYQEVKQVSGLEPAVIFESTGHYHEPVLQFLEDHDIAYYLINPVVAHESKKVSLRRVKTDAMDAFHLGELYYKEDLEVFQRKSAQILNLRDLTRSHSALTKTYVETKLQFQAILDQVFPEYHSVFSDLCGDLSLHLLQQYPTALAMQEATLQELASEMSKCGARRSWDWFLDKARQCKDAAERNPFQHEVYASHIVNLRMYIHMIHQYQKHLAELKKEIKALAQSFGDFQLIHSMPGIGDMISATIISEIGGIDQFPYAKKLAAYVGLDPSVFESGKFQASINPITKKGSARLRQALYTAVQCSIAKNRNTRLKAFYDRKRKEGKSYKVTMIACANKLVHWIHAMLRHQEGFVDPS